MIEPTEAHLQEACDLLNAEEAWDVWEGNDRVTQVFARYIANQQPAIAPDLVTKLIVAFTEVQWELERIDQSRATRFGRIGELIVHNRAILAELDASKPVDPLVEAFRAIKQTQCGEGEEWSVVIARNLREALADSGLHITETHND